jgi:aldos-2-ulose dehydratase
VTPFSAVSTVVNKHQDQHVTAGRAGALFVRMKHSTTSGQPPFSDMKQLVAHNILPEYFPADVRHVHFPWNKVEDLEWAHGNFKVTYIKCTGSGIKLTLQQGLEFYNLTGFSVKWDDDSLGTVCHIQLWTAGIGVSAGFHNHANQSFCEIHACIVNGTGEGGMAWANVPDGGFDPVQEDPSKYEKIVVPDMSEHGPLWRTNEAGLPLLRANDTVDYPWHGMSLSLAFPNQSLMIS